MIHEGGEVEWLEEKLWRDYFAHLAAHPDPRDPDYPELEDYGLKDEDE